MVRRSDKSALTGSFSLVKSVALFLFVVLFGANRPVPKYPGPGGHLQQFLESLLQSSLKDKDGLHYDRLC